MLTTAFLLYSIGMALINTLDDLIDDERINPQVAVKVLANFDQAMTEALQRHVKARMSFRVSRLTLFPRAICGLKLLLTRHRGHWTRTGSATRCGP